MSRILVVDDEATMRLVLRETLEEEGHEVVEAATAGEALEAAVAEEPDLVVLDIRLPDESGLDVLDRLKASDPDRPVVMITGDGSRELGLEAVERGAYDFFTKPFRNAELRVVVERALERQRLVREVHRLRRSRVEETSYGRLVGQSPAMREVYRSIERVADTDLPVLMEGESGTGKELVAEEIHGRSGRSDGPLVKVNCIAIPEGLMESELFGHEEGAFTGATSRRRGKFEQADGGTLFLDEVGDLPRELQGKLLRVLQEQSFERVGGSETITTDVRIVAATNKHLQAEVEEGAFREDLFYRLNVFPLRLPPLRERREDVPPLVEAFLEQLRAGEELEVRGVTPGALSALLAYDWPGNVRELRNALRSAAVRGGEGPVRRVDLPEVVRSAAGAPGDGETPAGEEDDDPDGSATLDDVLASVEASLIRRALSEHDGVQARAAESLGIGERSLWYRVKKYDIDPAACRPDDDAEGDG